MNKKKMENS